MNISSLDDALIERILFQKDLPLLETVRNQVICKRWKQVIEESKKARKRLAFHHFRADLNVHWIRGMYDLLKDHKLIVILDGSSSMKNSRDRRWDDALDQMQMRIQNYVQLTQKPDRVEIIAFGNEVYQRMKLNSEASLESVRNRLEPSQVPNTKLSLAIKEIADQYSEVSPAVRIRFPLLRRKKSASDSHTPGMVSIVIISDFSLGTKGEVIECSKLINSIQRCIDVHLIRVGNSKSGKHYHSTLSSDTLPKKINQL